MLKVKSTKHLSEEQVVSLVKEDYLRFCLSYDIGLSRFSFLSNSSVLAQSQIGNEFHLLGNGIIGVNLKRNNIDAKNIILSCGIHGNETAPIEICNELINSLTSGKLITPHRILFIFGNIPAMHVGQRFVKENLNRLFYKGVELDNTERERAKELMDTVDAFYSDAGTARFHYDLHTAIRPSKNEKFAVYPYLHGKPHNKNQLAFLSMCGVNTILLSQTPTTTFSYYSSFNHDADAFTVELGKVRPFGQNDMSKFSQVRESLSSLISEANVLIPDFHDCPIQIFTVNQVINKQQSDFKLHFSEDLANFESFSRGELLASEQGEEYFAEVDGEAVVFPNANVEIGQRALLTVIPHEL